MKKQKLSFNLQAAARTISTNAALVKILEILRILIQTHNTGKDPIILKFKWIRNVKMVDKK
jgi:hypothetical protein